jgi:hypothetical protein
MSDGAHGRKAGVTDARRGIEYDWHEVPDFIEDAEAYEYEYALAYYQELELIECEREDYREQLWEDRVKGY